MVYNPPGRPGYYNPGNNNNSSSNIPFGEGNPELLNSPYYQPLPVPSSGEDKEDTLSRLIRDRLNASRARYNQIGKQTGATEDQLLAALDPLKTQLGMLDDSSNLLAGLTNKLVSSSLGSTAGASMAAVNAARLSGDGRYGSGGMAAILAARGATDAAVGQSAALSQALVQGQLGEANFQQQYLAQRGGIATALSQLLQSQAGLREDRAKLGVAMETEHGNILSNSMQVYGGIAEKKEDKSWKDDFPGLLGIV